MLRPSLLGLCAALLLLPSAVYGQDEAAQGTTLTRPAMVFETSARANDFVRTYPGIVRPAQEAELSFRVPGRMIELPVLASDFVRQGDVIAVLDPRDYEAGVAQLEGQVDQATAQLSALRAGARSEEIAALEAAVDAAQAQVDQAQEQVDRTEQLASTGVVSQARLNDDRAALRVALAQLRSAQEQLTIGRTGGRAEDIEAAEAAFRSLEAQLQTARDSLADTVLRAPFDGYIARRDLENFTNIQAGQSVVLLQKLSTVRLAFDVPGPDVTVFSVADDLAIEVTFDALPAQDFPGELVEFVVDADVTTQTYHGQVEVMLPEDAPVLPGMVGRITASTPQSDDSLFIPLSAVGATVEGSSFVWRVDADTNIIAQTPVVLGDISGDMVDVLEGLEPGQSIVRAGVSRLMDGMAIRPITRVGG